MGVATKCFSRRSPDNFWFSGQAIHYDRCGSLTVFCLDRAHPGLRFLFGNQSLGEGGVAGTAEDCEALFNAIFEFGGQFFGAHMRA